ncbi:MAG: decaprenylphospho-beta-D-erythro-pentofuranosid-2-ulose 2-reductase [Ilumatobacteraceae bacterium]|nr:decaprenylphospho-beta-D-erythro-pentofuranosid-2-ulose 2-reductase [Ilumatobacteraceae bacterium]
MQNAFGETQNIVVLGGMSEIGLAIARRLITPATKSVVLACRRPDAATTQIASLQREGVDVRAVAFDAADTDSHEAFVEQLRRDHGDPDVVILAFGQLGDQDRFDEDPATAVKVAHVNYTGAVSVSLHVAKQLRRQGHGRLIVLSSVAGERVRKANFVYGSTKAGLDGFAQGLSDSLEGSGARVLIVRPGFVHSAMTTGMKAAPFATTPDAVADVTVRGLKSGRRIVWAPGILRLVFAVLRHLPGPVWRRLPLG